MKIELVREMAPWTDFIHNDNDPMASLPRSVASKSSKIVRHYVGQPDILYLTGLSCCFFVLVLCPVLESNCPVFQFQVA